MSTLGVEETVDVEAALEFALSNGARQLVLVGWSMGGQIALHLLRNPRFSPHISAVVLVAPALKWRAAIRQGARKKGLPAWVGDMGAFALSNTALSRVVGLREPIPIKKLDFTREPADIPMLILHATQDPDVPIHPSKEFQARNPDLVTLQEFDSAGHAWEYNRAPQPFTDAIEQWLQPVLDLAHERTDPIPSDAPESARRDIE